MPSYVRNIQGADSQFKHFIPNYAQGLSQPGLLRLNQSIEAFVYCVLGAQVDSRSSTIGKGERAAEAHSQFLVLLEGEIRSPDILKSVSRYQHAIENAKVRLDFAVAPGCWPLPLAHDSKHKKCRGLQQQPKTGNAMDESRGEH